MYENLGFLWCYETEDTYIVRFILARFKVKSINKEEKNETF